MSVAERVACCCTCDDDDIGDVCLLLSLEVLCRWPELIGYASSKCGLDTGGCEDCVVGSAPLDDRVW